MQGAAFGRGLAQLICLLCISISLAYGKDARDFAGSKHRHDAQAQQQRSDDMRVPHPLTEEPGKRDVAPQIPQDQAPKPEEYKKPCESPAKREEDDTCSQWRSANAAEAATRAAIDQASLAWWGIWVGVVSAIATAVAALAAAAAARAAVMATKEAGDANSIARETAERELRAYVFASRAVIDFTETSAKVNIAIVNYGQTPAYNFDHVTRILVCILPFEPDYIRDDAVRRDLGDSLPPNGNFGVIIESGPLSYDAMALVIAGTTPIIVHGTIWYDDAFGKSRHTKFRFVYRGVKTDPPGVMMAAEKGNEAT